VVFSIYSVGSGKRGKNRVSRECLSKRREEGNVLFSQRREIATNAAEHGNSWLGAEAAGDLLLHLDHAQVSFGLVVVKRHRKIMEEPKHLPLSLRETIQQIARRALFGSSRQPLSLC
jgi:hypothetical protein